MKEKKMVQQKTSLKVNKLVSNSTVNNRWLLVYSFDEKAEGISDGGSEKVMEESVIGNYSTRISKLWDLTGISKEDYSYSELVNYGRQEC